MKRKTESSNPPRRAPSRVPQPPVCLTRPPSRCSRCGAMRGYSELVQRRSVAEDAKRVKNSLGACPRSEQRCIAAVAKVVLLQGPYFYNGKHINPVGKSIGAGVWAITHKEENP